ncbi:MAG: response regulator transcription factor [Actinomycetales bacterium]|nr:response regulator transcription factor [Actinomycetales bacterium]
MMREALVERLVCHSADMEVIYAGDSIVEAVRVSDDRKPDCIVLDLDLGDGRPPMETVTEVVQIGAPVLVVSAAATPRSVQGAISRGASGYLSKQSPAHEFQRAVDIVLRGQVYLSPELAAMLSVRTPGSVQLSPQEERALLLYSSGMKMASVGRIMGISPGTAKEYIRRVRVKYAEKGEPLPSKVELYKKAQEEGLL